MFCIMYLPKYRNQIIINHDDPIVYHTQINISRSPAELSKSSGVPAECPALVTANC